MCARPGVDGAHRRRRGEIGRFGGQSRQQRVEQIGHVRDGVCRVIGRREGTRVAFAEDGWIAEGEVAGRAVGVVRAEGVAGEDVQVEEGTLTERALDEPELGRLEPAGRREEVAKALVLQRREEHVVVVSAPDVRHDGWEHLPGGVAEAGGGRHRGAPEGRGAMLVGERFEGPCAKGVVIEVEERLGRARHHAQVEDHLLEHQLEQLVDDDEDALVGDGRGGHLSVEEAVEVEVVRIADGEATVFIGPIDKRKPVLIGQAERVRGRFGVKREGPPGGGSRHGVSGRGSR